ncbi:uncharacterized protein LOC127731837 isoform X2 [Mytilus californianus]|uniref:uncharacterized protein LOC127731837 isoform X2 n=1 Tax=Mytilus californianus TaxID=6549 RepID=UPI002246472D|nr:uncharacterized protein LOC127731837 isoform X2 [Mytilus californianus]XP_052096640.1 uncharacterized protein LOC127731837 isoform X2 [Mytilus californianus]
MEYWNKKLLADAQTGNVNDVKICLENKADIEYQSVSGWTALMRAAMGGYLEVCRLLIDTGCKIDTTEEDGETALMRAAMGGYLEVCRLLIDTGCKIDTTEMSGYTALHWAAERGRLQITRCLVEQGGANPMVTTHKGQTPYDLAAEYKSLQYKEVMEYLQSVMSEESSGVTAGQGMEVAGDMVPTEIKLMADKRSIDLYLKLLESGSEKKRDIRLVIVGKKGAGKTSLIKRLFSEENTDVTSTNGIEIHTIKCKAMSDDGIWNKLDGTNKETEIHARLLKQYKGKIEASVQEVTHEVVRENTLITILYKRIEESKESETVSQQPKKRILQVTTESQVEPPVTSQQRNQSLKQAKLDIETMLKSNVDLHDKEEYATLLLWDFAGDEEFYHTHQTFLSSGAIYLVVTKLNEADDKNAQDLFQLWMDSIHCYSRLEEDKSNSADSKTSDDLDPPVVIVGTWKDAVTSDVEEIDDACRENIFKFTKNMSEDELKHIRQEYFISNTEDDPSVFQQIREDILNLARKIKTWNKVYPLKFIQLEKRLQEKKKELPIISFQEMQHISTNTPNPLNDEELRLFLEFHHEIRALVYFKDLSSYIILDTQWLSDAFKCIVTAKKFRAFSTRNRTKWDELYSRGKLHSEVLDDIFRKSENIFAKHKDHILNVMEKFDIIIRPNISETQRDAGDDKPLYYVPCMIKSEPECDVYEMFNVTENTCNKSTWLCYKFRFLPPHLMNHLIASLCRKYKVAEVVTKEQKRQIALFRGSAVFELQKTTKLAKLHIMKCPNWIQIQVWQFEKGRQGGMYKYIDDFVTEEIVKIISTRFKMSNVKFEKKWECGQTRPESVTGSFDCREDQDTKYYCETCKIAHEFTGEWSDLQCRTVDLLQSSANVPISNPYTESSSQIQTTVQSTKVRVRVQAGERVFSNANEGATGTASSAGFTNEEINFAKMGMIALNILADVLYDLLKPDKPNLRPRSDSDITYLYSEHRKLNKHIPTNGWGGKWQVDQITGIVTGDDIERIRLTRNELQHSKTFKLEETRFNELRIIICDLLKRLDHYNKPQKLYTHELKDILAKTFSDEDVNSVKNEILEMTVEVEIEQQINVLTQ